MNQLQHESSPYLLQHKNNPVDWNAWNDSSLQRAKDENKPILVSIGYSTCHWCHVMEHESFEDKQVARFMNENFINIKIDREERPDLDAIYMQACQIIAGTGGWPLNVFLTPDLKPFFAGTYFPPVEKYGRKSWLQTLQFVLYNFKENRAVVETEANKVLHRIQGVEKIFDKDISLLVQDDNIFKKEYADEICKQLETYFDTKNGGFGGAPKFPNIMNLEYLLKYHHFTKNETALNHVIFSLDKMLQGGIYDHLGGGLARYSTDERWLAPHFEKMLYDNGLLLGILAEAYQVTGFERYKTIIDDITLWIDNEMTSPEGGIYAALDADSEGVEGKFYVWDKHEIDQVLGKDAPLFCAFFDVSKTGNWEYTNILNIPIPMPKFVKNNNLKLEDFQNQINKNKSTLLEIRNKRIHPHRDEKILLSWNALLCIGYAKVAKALNSEKYKKKASQLLQFLLDKFQKENGELWHTYTNQKAHIDGQISDYGYLISAILEVYEFSQEESLLKKAESLTEKTLELFSDEKSTLFVSSPKNQDHIIVNQKEIYDAERPSGNSMMMMNLKKLGLLIGNDTYMDHSYKMLVQMKDVFSKQAFSFSKWATAMLIELYGLPEIAIIGEKASDYLDEINMKFIPEKIIMTSANTNDNFPLMEGKVVKAGETLIYVCEGFACRKPVGIDELEI